jgi:hypothetical protein
MTPRGRFEDCRAVWHLRAHNHYRVAIVPAMMTTMMNNHHYLGHERLHDRRAGRGKK